MVAGVARGLVEKGRSRTCKVSLGLRDGRWDPTPEHGGWQRKGRLPDRADERSDATPARR